MSEREAQRNRAKKLETKHQTKASAASGTAGRSGTKRSGREKSGREKSGTNGGAWQPRAGYDPIRLRGEVVLSLSPGIVVALRSAGAGLVALWAWVFAGIWQDSREARVVLSGWESDYGRFGSGTWGGASSEAGQALVKVMHTGNIPDLYLMNAMTGPLAIFAMASFFLFFAGWRSRNRVFVAIFLGSAQVVLYLVYRHELSAVNAIVS